jgi:hypothetical protein
MKRLDVELTGQLTQQWCWATCAQMVMRYFGKNITQCEQANALFKRTDCCHSVMGRGAPFKPISACAKAGNPDWNYYGFEVTHSSYDTPLTYEELVAQIDANKPVCFSWKWNSGGSHMLVAIGYWNSFQLLGDVVLVNDPWPVNKGEFKIISYHAYVSGVNYTHGRDTYDITKVDLKKRRVKKSAQIEMEPAGKSNSDFEQFAKCAIVSESILNWMNGTKSPDEPQLLMEATVPYSHQNGMSYGKAIPIKKVTDKTFDSNGEVDDDELLTDTKEALFPIYESETLIGSARMRRIDGEWILQCLGGLAVVEHYLEACQNNTISGDCFLLDISERYKVFLAIETDADLTLVDLFPDEDEVIEETTSGYATLKAIIAKPFEGGVEQVGG